MHTRVPERYMHTPNGKLIEPKEREANLNADLKWCRRAMARCNALMEYTETLCNKPPVMSNKMILCTRALVIALDINFGMAKNEHGETELGEGWETILN